jgi:hypothetical protein
VEGQGLLPAGTRARLTKAPLRDDPHRKEVWLSPDQWQSLVTWVDLDAHYCGTFVEKDVHYASRKAARNGGAIVPPLRVRVVFPDPWTQPPASAWF